MLEADARQAADADDEESRELDGRVGVDMAVEALVGGTEIAGDGLGGERTKARDWDADGADLAGVAQLELADELHLVVG